MTCAEEFGGGPTEKGPRGTRMRAGAPLLRNDLLDLAAKRRDLGFELRKIGGEGLQSGCEPLEILERPDERALLNRM